MKKYEQTRQKILVAAESLLSNQRVSTVTIDQITERAHIHRSTFYRYFPTFSDLILALVDQKLEDNIPKRSGIEETTLLVLNLFEQNFLFFRNILLGGETLNLNFQTILVNRMVDLQSPTIQKVDYANTAEIEMLYQTVVAIFICWVSKPYLIKKEDILLFLKKYFKFTDED